MRRIGILKPEEAGAKAKRAVAEWEAGKRKAGLRARVAPKKPEPIAAHGRAALSEEEKETLGDKIRIAASHGDRDEVKRLLDAGADVNAKDELGRTALMAAASCGRQIVVGLLMKRKADPDAKKGDRGTTALMMASSAGNTECVRELLAEGANPDIRDNARRTALMMAKEKGYNEIIGLLEQYGATDLG